MGDVDVENLLIDIKNIKKEILLPEDIKTEIIPTDNIKLETVSHNLKTEPKIKTESINSVSVKKKPNKEVSARNNVNKIKKKKNVSARYRRSNCNFYFTNPINPDLYHYSPRLMSLIYDSKDFLNVTIRDKNSISKAQSLILKRVILQRIIEESPNGTGPKIRNEIYYSGRMIIVCEDVISSLWLRKVVPSLKPWPGAVLTVDNISDNSKQTVLVHAWVTEAKTPHEAVSLLKAQNPSLGMELWEMYHVNYDPFKFFLYFNVPDVCVQALTKVCFQLFYGLQRIQAVIM